MRHLLRKTGTLLLAGLALTFGTLSPWPVASAAGSEATDKPKSRLSPEIEIQSGFQPATPAKVASDDALKDEKEEKPGWFSRNKWWVFLGVVAAGAAAAIAASGNSGGEEDGGMGSYDAGW